MFGRKKKETNVYIREHRQNEENGNSGSDAYATANACDQVAIMPYCHRYISFGLPYIHDINMIINK